MVTIVAVSGCLAAVGRIDAALLCLPAWLLLTTAVFDSGGRSTLPLASFDTSTRRAIEGDEIEIEVRFSGSFRGVWLEAELGLDAGLEATERSRRLVRIREGRAPGDGLTVSYRVAAWGLRSPRTLRIAAYDRFLLVVHEEVWTLDQGTADLVVAVHPPALRLDNLVKLHRTRSMTGGHRSTARGAGMELAEVRLARSGDAAAKVHPRLSARRGAPMVVEHHPEQASDVVILIDSTSDIGTRLDSTLRWTVQAALALQRVHVRGMDRVGIIDVGGTIQWLEPRMGRGAGHRIVRTLLSIQAQRGVAAGEQASGLPLARLPPGCLVIAFSPGLSEAFNRDVVRIRRRGHQVMFVELDLDENIGEQMSSRVQRVLRELRHRDLRHHGVVVNRWDTTKDFTRVLASVERVRSRPGQVRP